MAARLKVLLLGNYREDRQHSMLGFGRALLEDLPGHGIDVEFIAPRRILRSPVRRLEKWLAYADKYVLFPRSLRKAAGRANVVHVLDQGNGIYVNHLTRVPHVVTCHDLLAIRAARGELPYWQMGYSGKVYQRAILRGLRRAKFVACVSGATLSDARRLLGLPEDRLATIHNGLYGVWQNRSDTAPPSGVLGASFDQRTPYLLHVGNASPYKNRIGAVHIFSAIQAMGGPPRLVLAGKSLSPGEREYVESGAPHGSVVEVSGPTAPDLEWLYSNASALLVTSFDEGFGLPIIEAQACGCPVCIPDKEPMTEVAGDAAVEIDIDDAQKAATSVMEGIRNSAQLRTRGYQNVEKYSRGAMIGKYVDVYTDQNRG